MAQREARRPSSETAKHTTHGKKAQKSAGQNTGTNRIAILEEKPGVVKQPWLTAGTLQEDLTLSSEEVRDDEHLRCPKILLHRTKQIVRELPLIFKGFL